MSPASTETELTVRFEQLLVSQITPSKTNPRTHFDDAYLTQLAESIREKGIVEPLLVRPVPVGRRNGGQKLDAQFELVAGECRYRAATSIGAIDVPCLIRTLTDEQALELQLIENLHRRDLTPLEEAGGFRALIKSNPDKHSAASIAQRIGKSPSWVWDLLKLLELVPEAKNILEAGLMNVGHAILIARLKPEDQKRVISVEPLNGYGGRRQGLWQYHGGRLEYEDAKAERAAEKAAGKYDDVKAVSVRELDAWIRDHIRFDVAHAAKAQPFTFEQTAAKVEEVAAQPGRGKKVISITHEYRVADDARDGAERTYGSQSWERADGKLKSKTCEHAVLGLVVAGRGQGDHFEVCVARDKCKVHFGKVIAAREKSQKLRDSGKTKQADRNEVRTRAREEEQRRKDEEQEAAWRKLEPLIIAEAVGQAKKVKTLTARHAKVIVNSDLYDNLGFVMKDHLGASWFRTPVAAWLVMAIAGNNPQSYDDFIKDIATPLGFDLKRFAAIREKHEPTAEPVATSGVKAKKRSKAKSA